MEHVRLRSGLEVAIRPIRREDDERLRAAYDRLSPESQYRRFFTPKPHLSTTETHYLVDVDGNDHFALIATPESSEEEEIIAVARFVRLKGEGDVAEPAVVVGDRFQGQGLASAMFERLAEAARERGITRFRASVLAENRPARALVRGLAGSRSRERLAGPIREFEVRLDGPADAPAESVRERALAGAREGAAAGFARVSALVESGRAMIGPWGGSSRSERDRRSSATASRSSTRRSMRSRPGGASSRPRRRDSG